MISLSKVLEAAEAHEELQGFKWRGSVIRCSVADALKTGRLNGVSGLYALSSIEPEEHIIFLGFSDDVGSDLVGLAEGRTSGILELVLTRMPKDTFVETVPAPKEVVRQIYRVARRVLRDEFDMSLRVDLGA